MGRYPPHWKVALTELLKRRDRRPSMEEIEWARAYEQDQLRAWARFPRPGDIYEAVRDVQLAYVTHWRAPFTGGGECVFPAGARLAVLVPHETVEPVGVYASPLEYGRFEQVVVPEAERRSEKYEGYSLYAATAVLNRDFSLWHDAS